ncbi:MAG TPA: glycosyltransferase family 2 protein [Beijerinckiaceae bacterium]|nr:glycosyltransferase family 2 protein [Beijerinckiaceae bacterium]
MSGGPVPDLSIFIITKNEADRLPRTLAAVRNLSDDIVVVDSGSSDDTCALAIASGARVVENEWPGYGPQKRFAEEQCHGTWLLNIDADEVVPPELGNEIRAAVEFPFADAYEIRIAEIFPGERRPHSLGYALAPVRLYRRDKGRYSPSPVHDRVDLAPDARVARLKGVVHHFSVRSIGDQIAKLNAYTDQQVDDLAARGKHVPVWRLFVEFPASFLKAYIGRRHFARGLYGVITATNFAFYRWLRVAKDVERRLLERDAARQKKEGNS